MSTKKNTIKKNTTKKNTVINEQNNNQNEDKKDNNIENNQTLTQDELNLDLGSISENQENNLENNETKTDNNEIKKENYNLDEIKQANNNNKYYTTHQAAKIIGVTPATIIAWTKTGKIKAIKTLGGHRRIEQSVIDELLNTMKINNN